MLEDIVGRLAEQAHFQVVRNPGTASPRQTDLHLAYGPERYLVECKWTSHPAGTGEIDDVRVRLRRTAPGATGVLVSMSGFTAEAAAAAKSDRGWPVLLVDGSEVLDVLHDRELLRNLLEDKGKTLTVHGRVHLSGRAVTATWEHVRPRPGRRTLHVVAPDGMERKWTPSSNRGYGVWTPALSLPDPDWAWPTASGSVLARLDLDTGRGEPLRRTVRELTRVGWTGDDVPWTIRQSGTDFFGFGADGFLAAVDDWRVRGAVLANGPHHTEELSVLGHAPDNGLWSLTGDVTAVGRRWVRRLQLVLCLEGWPLDREPVRRLAAALGAKGTPVFRPLTGPLVERDHLHGNRPRLEPVARVLSRGTDHDGATDEWVVGLIVVNPFLAPSGDDSHVTKVQLDDPSEGPFLAVFDVPDPPAAPAPVEEPSAQA